MRTSQFATMAASMHWLHSKAQSKRIENRCERI